jgi:branched-chain amino acid transport system permease protein
MNEFLSSLVRGLGSGSVYALIALGFVIIYKSTRIISFAQPALMLTGAVLVSYLYDPIGFYPAVVAAMVLVALLGVGIERSVLRPMVGKPAFVVAIITIGIDVVVRVVVNGYIGLNVRPLGDPWGLDTVEIAGVIVQIRYLVMFGTGAVVVAALFAFFQFSRHGLAMRAAAFDQEAAMAQGISVGTVFALSWALAGALATLAGMFVGTESGVEQQLWIVALKALPAIILGGLDSLGGAVVGGLAVGVVESLAGTYQGEYAPWLGNNFADVTPYIVMFLVLLVRPYGLRGTREVIRV